MTTNTTARVPVAEEATTAHSARPPATVVGAAALAGLAALVGGYGAVYFTGLDGFTQLGVTFVVAYEFLGVVGLISAVALLRGRPLGQAGTILYGTWMVVFTLFKVAYIHETEAIPFGIVGLLVVGLALAPATRRYVGR